MRAPLIVAVLVAVGISTGCCASYKEDVDRYRAAVGKQADIMAADAEDLRSRLDVFVEASIPDHAKGVGRSEWMGLAAALDDECRAYVEASKRLADVAAGTGADDAE